MSTFLSVDDAGRWSVAHDNYYRIIQEMMMSHHYQSIGNIGTGTVVLYGKYSAHRIPYYCSGNSTVEYWGEVRGQE